MNTIYTRNRKELREVSHLTRKYVIVKNTPKTSVHIGKFSLHHRDSNTLGWFIKSSDDLNELIRCTKPKLLRIFA